MSEPLRNDPTNVSAAVARNVRLLRGRRGWTLDELARRARLSKGMVVQIERGGTNASIATLCRLADGLGVTVTRLIESDEASTDPIVRTEAAVTLWSGKPGSAARLLAGVEGPELCELWEWRLAPADVYKGQPHPPGTREVVHVLQGTLTVRVNRADHTAKRGETLVFRADRPHEYANSGARPVRFTLVLLEPPTASPGGSTPSISPSSASTHDDRVRRRQRSR